MQAPSLMSIELRPAARPAISTGAVLGYALGSLGTGIFSTVPTVLLLYYCTEILRLPAAWATLIVFIPKVWAIVWDPFVGAWSDRTRSRFGRRRPFLVAGTVGVACAFLTLFAAPSTLTPETTAVWVGIAYFALATLYSLFAVPYIAVPAEIGEDREARTRLVRWRMTFAMIGVLAGAGLAPWIVALAGGGRHGYATMALALAIVCGLAMSSPVVMLRSFDVGRPAARGQPASSFLRDLPKAFSSRRFVWLALSYLLMLTGAGALLAAAPYLMRHVLGRADADLGSALGLMLVVTTVAIPFCSHIGRRVGEARVLPVGVVAYGLVAAVLGILSYYGLLSWLGVLTIFAALGVPFAATQVLPFTLLAHTIHDERHRHAAAEGIFTGMWTAAEKLGLALGPAIMGVALAIGGEPKSVTPVFLATVPMALMLAALLPLFLARRTDP